MADVVGERSRITIDRTIRKALGIRPGHLAGERVEDGRLVVSFTATMDESVRSASVPVRMI